MTSTKERSFGKVNLSDVEFETTKDLDVTTTFDAMGLREDLLRGIYDYGIKKPSGIQQRAIKPIINGKDVIAQAQSGTGKTAMFSIGILQNIDIPARKPQALVMSPTRELAEQTRRVILAIGSHMNVQCYAYIGGTDRKEDIRKLRCVQHVVTGTPGRILDMIAIGKLKTREIKILVLDEADELLANDLKSQIHTVYRYLSPSIQIVLISATFPHKVLELTTKFMHEPVHILVKRDELTLDGIKQFFVPVIREEWKLDTLCDLYSYIIETHAVIFCNTRTRVNWLAEKLREANFPVSAIHAGIGQSKRRAIIKQFRCTSSGILVTSDMSARGLDVPQVPLVINYDVPSSREVYIHRIGRSGRFGRMGVAISFATNDEVMGLRNIEQYYSTQIEELSMNVADYMA